MDKHLFFFSTDKHPSPFDINIALDSGFDHAIPYSSVTEDETIALAQDVIFSRGPKGARKSGIFIGGGDIDLAEKIASRVVSCMFEPFRVSVFTDPKGAYTTAAALVAKVSRCSGGLEGKRIVIFGGTGPVGMITASLAAGEGGEASVVSSRSREAAALAAERAGKMAGREVQASAASSEEERIALAREADIVIATVKAGVQVLGGQALHGLRQGLVVADVNAAPPPGIGGLSPDDDMKEIAPGVKGIGALAVGRIKYKVQAELYRKMTREWINAGYRECYELAKTLA